jgi:hypothetical protein
VERRKPPRDFYNPLEVFVFGPCTQETLYAS